MECPSASRLFPNHSIRLPVDAGRRGRCHIAELAGIVRYLADHFTAECSTSRFYSNVFVTYLLYRLYYDGLFRMKYCPKTFLPRCHFMKTMQLQVHISVLFLLARR